MSDDHRQTSDEAYACGEATAWRALPWYARTWVRLAVCFVFVTTVPLVVTAIYTTHRHVAVIRNVALAAAAERAGQSARRLEQILYTARSDLLSLAEWPIWESYQSADSEADRAFWRDKLTVQLRTFVELKPQYQSLVYTDESGGHRLHVTRQGTATSVNTPGRPLSTVECELLARTISLMPRQVKWELVKNDDVRTLLCAARVVSRNVQTRGAVWLALEGAALLDVCTPVDADTDAVALYDDHGMLRFSTSSSAPESMPQGRVHQHIDATGSLVSESPVSMDPSQGRPSWRLALFDRAGVLDTGVHDFRAAFLTLLGAALFIAILLSIWLARQFSNPLQRVYQASQRIGRGEFDVQLSDTTGDEIGALAEQIDIMAGQLRGAHDDFERRLAEKTDQLVHAERLSTIGRTAAAVAHEINNPSGIISMYAQMLTERLPLGDPNLEKLQVIKDKAREISSIVSELLDYSRKPAPKREWVDCKALVAQALHDAAVVSRDAESGPAIKQTTSIGAEAKRLYVDPHQMGRVLRNLVMNACQAMPGGGELSIRCRRAPDGGTCIEIADAGTGMDSEQLRHLFDPFYTTKRFGAGTGLGLAISKEITERHGGRVTVRSEPGKGTVVSIWLPDAPATYEI